MTMTNPTNQADTRNIAFALVEQARQQPDAVAIHYPVSKRGGRVNYRSASYAELNGISDDYARGLVEYGIGRGVRTALMVTPGLDFFALFFALFITLYHSQLLAEPKRVVKIGGAQMPPLIYLDSDDQVAGIIPLLMEQVALENNWTLDWTIDTGTSQLR